MNRSEFLKRLREALENDLSGQVVQENVDYYNQYISDEVKSGKSEEEVLEMLGDPWMLARTVIDAPGGDKQSNGQEAEADNQRKKEESNSERTTKISTGWWKKVAVIGGIILIFILGFSIVTGIIRILAPILIPVLIVTFLINRWKRRR